MHIAIDIRLLGHSGIGRYIQQLVPRVIAARPGWRFSLLGTRAATERAGWHDLDNATVIQCTAPIYSVTEQLEVSQRCPADADLLWTPHFNIPVFRRGGQVTTVHDVAHLELRDVVRGIKRGYARAMFEAVARKSAAIMCVSHFTRAELLRHVPSTRVDPVVAHLGVERGWQEAAATARLHPRPYVISVGNVKPHKNLQRLVAAFDAISDDVPHDLVVVGKREGMRTIDHAAQARSAVTGDRVVFTGEVHESALRSYVAHAELLVMPSLYEGFGLPPLEAMAAGCPTLVSRAASLPEVCGDAAAYCDPRDVNDIAAQLKRVLLDHALRTDLRARGRRHAAAFTWERTAGATLQVLEQAVGRAGSGRD